MALSAIASPATLHRKLNALREAGYIDQEYKARNRRTIDTPVVVMGQVKDTYHRYCKNQICEFGKRTYISVW